MSMNKKSKSVGNMENSNENLNTSKGFFLSAIHPKIGPNIINDTDSNTIKNCKTPPSIPINAPNVLPVVPRNCNGIAVKKLAKANLQNLKVLSILL